MSDIVDVTTIRDLNDQLRRSLAGGVLVIRGCSLRHGSILSGVGASDKPGAVHYIKFRRTTRLTPKPSPKP